MATTRILIIRTSALGDVVHALPVLTAIRRNLQDARIGWLVEAVFAPLLDGHPDLDQVITIPLKQWRRRPLARRTWTELVQFLTTLDRFAPEIVLDLMGNHKGGMLAALTLADRRIGLDRRSRREPSSAIWISEPISPRGRHVVDQSLSLLDALGLSPEPADFAGIRIPLGRGAAAPVAVASAGRVLIHPGAGWANKRYPPRLWGEVARLLEQMSGLRTGVIVGPGEQQLAAEVVSSGTGAAEAILAPDLDSLGRLLRSAALVMGGDTGPIHLAQALGRPVLCLMGPTDPERNGPYGSPQTVIWRRLPCSFCHKRFPQTMPCLLEIAPETVADRARIILEGRDLPTPAPIDEGETGCADLH